MGQIIGYKGGKDGGGGSATEEADTLHSISYAKLLDLVSEGQIEGFVDGAKSIYFDKTPLQNADGTYNFSNVSVDFRPGTQFQDVIAGFPNVENETSVGVELRADTPYTRYFTNTQLSAVRVTLAVPALSQTNTNNGNVGGYTVEYAIDINTDGAGFVQYLQTAFSGKTTSEYQRSHRIELPAATTGWTIRVRRITADTSSSYIQDTTTIKSVTEIIDARLRYPMSAIVGIKIDAKQFSNIPTRAYHLKGRIIRVPSNYDPVNRTYAGAWNGTFNLAYSNNPAWVFYDLVLNDRYGLGDRIDSTMIDKWTLYQIGQYCDVMVSDGKGGTEPRFTCNVYIQQRADAYKVLQDLATTFRGMAYYAGGAIYATADMPTDPVYTYTNANVIDGKFKTVGTAQRTRYNTALVTWNDPNNFYESTVETVQDQDGINRYGIQQIEVTAFGCTSQGQAQRVGLWNTITSRLETQSKTFSVGMDGLMALPGQIVRIADSVTMGRRSAGRIRSATGKQVIVDKAATISTGDKFIAVLPTGKAQQNTVASVSGNIVTVVDDWTTLPLPDSIWSVDSSELAAPTYKITSISENSDGTFEISAIQHIPGKFNFIDNGTRIDTPPTTIITPSIQKPPTNVVLSSYAVSDQGISKTNMTIAWDRADNAIGYVVEWKRDDYNWVALPQTGEQSVDVPNIYAGQYVARVKAVSGVNVKSSYAYSIATNLLGKTSPPPVVTFLTATPKVFGIDLAWGFPTVGASDTQRTEIWYSPNSSIDSATKLSDLAYPQNSYSLSGLQSGAEFWFWARLVDTTGNIGSFYPAGVGVHGVSSTNSSEILSYLTGQIGKTQLGQDIVDAIDQVQNLEDLLAQVPDAATINQIIAKQSNAEADSDAIAAQQLYALAANDKSESVLRTAIRANFQTQQAQIVNEATVRATETGALATQISTLTATTEDISASVQTNATAIANTNGSLAAMYTIKTQVTSDGKTYLAGVGIGVDNASGILQSQVLVTADRFAILNQVTGTTTLVSPFAVTGGQVYINSAVIQDGSITNAKIGNTIQSTATNPATGQPVWILDKNGTFQMNGTGTTRLNINSSNITVYDGAGTLRVRMGIW